MQVSAASKLVPVAHAAEIRPSSRGNLLRQLLSANVEADLFGKELVRAVINVSRMKAHWRGDACSTSVRLAQAGTTTPALLTLENYTDGCRP